MRARPKRARAASRSRSCAAERSVGRDHDHAGAVGATFGACGVGRGLQRREGVSPQLAPHRYAVHREDAAEVRLDEDPQRVAPEPLGQAPRRGADAALPAEGDGAGAGADRALRHGPSGRGPDRGDDVLPAHGKGADVVEPAVVRLAHEGVHRAHAVVAGLGERPGHDGLDGGPHRERVREDDRRLDRAELAHLGGARQLPERVADEHGSRDLLLEEVPAVGQDGGDSGADVLALDERRLADADAGDVRDRVQGAGREDAGGEAEVASARPGLGQAPRDGAGAVLGVRQLHEDRSRRGVEPAQQALHRLGLEGGAARGRGLGPRAQVQEDAAPAARDDRRVVVAHPDDETIELVLPKHVLGRRPVSLRPPFVGELVVVGGARVVDTAQRGRRLAVRHAGAGGCRLRVAGDEAQVEDAGRRLAVALALLGAREPARMEAPPPREARAPERGLDGRADRRPRGVLRGPLACLQHGPRRVPIRAHREDHLPALVRHGRRGRDEHGEHEHGIRPSRAGGAA